MRYMWIIPTLLSVQGCLTTETLYTATHNPVCAHEVEQQLKTRENWER